MEIHVLPEQLPLLTADDFQTLFRTGLLELLRVSADVEL